MHDLINSSLSLSHSEKQMSAFNFGKAMIHVFMASLQAKIRPDEKCPSTALELTMGSRGQDRGTGPEKVKKAENGG